MDRNVTIGMPAMLTGDKLMQELTILPGDDDSIRTKPIAQRLTALSDLYRLYIPSSMSMEIYSKFYLALMRSMAQSSKSLKGKKVL